MNHPQVYPKVLLKIVQVAWYPEPVKCRLCNKDTQDIYRVQYWRGCISRIPSQLRTKNVCPACVREMEREQ